MSAPTLDARRVREWSSHRQPVMVRTYRAPVSVRIRRFLLDRALPLLAFLGLLALMLWAWGEPVARWIWRAM